MSTAICIAPARTLAYPQGGGHLWVYLQWALALPQISVARGDVRVAPHHIHFTIGETVGTPAACFPDCGLRWHYTRPPVFLPEWPPIPADSTAPYTTVTHWWGSTFEFRGQTIN